jgi:hypothetical protein
MIFGAFFLFLAFPTWAALTPNQNASLKDIPAIIVAVENISPDAERDGLTQSQLQTQVELRLRKMGVAVLPLSIASTLAPMLPGFLHVFVSTMRLTELPMYAVSISVRFYQRVTLPRNHNLELMGVTWETTAIGAYGAHKLRDVQSRVIDYIDEFINAYLEQNPKR